MTTGEPAGIGPELSVQAVQAACVEWPDVHFTVLGDCALLAERAAAVQIDWTALQATGRVACQHEALRARLHRFAMETCAARIDPHTVFALAPRANRLKHALKLPSQARQCSRFIACAVLPAAISGNTESARRIASGMSACSSGGGGLSTKSATLLWASLDKEARGWPIPMRSRQ